MIHIIKLRPSIIEKSNEYKIKTKVSVARFSVYDQQVETQNEYQTNKTY